MKQYDPDLQAKLLEILRPLKDAGIAYIGWAFSSDHGKEYGYVKIADANDETLGLCDRAIHKLIKAHGCDPHIEFNFDPLTIDRAGYVIGKMFIVDSVLNGGSEK